MSCFRIWRFSLIVIVEPAYISITFLLSCSFLGSFGFNVIRLETVNNDIDIIVTNTVKPVPPTGVYNERYQIGRAHV